MSQLKIGDRVFVGGSVGRVGKILGVQKVGPKGIAYYVKIDGDSGISGPYGEVWKAGPRSVSTEPQ